MMMFDRRLIQYFDWVLLLLLLIIAGVSILNLYSATYAVREVGGSQIFLKQIYWFAIGFCVLLAMMTFSYNLLQKIAYPLYFLSVGLLVLVLIFGRISSGSQRWLSLGPVVFQPSELAKIALLIVLSRFFSERASLKRYRLRDLWQPFLIIALPTVLVLKQPDLGTALLLVSFSFSIILLVGMNWKSFLILILSVIAFSPVAWMHLREYQKNRIMTFLMPEMDPLGTGYHVNQSKIAIGSGMMVGKGYLKGTQTRLDFLPEQHTDFAFSVLAEEWGFAGSLVLLLLYLLVVLWGLNIAKISRDRFGTILAVGIVALVFWQVVINVGMVTGLLPVVGTPLLLISYGGSSLVTTMAALGLIMNISMRRFMFSTQ
jgi:rod shape determining protein RodA